MNLVATERVTGVRRIHLQRVTINPLVHSAAGSIQQGIQPRHTGYEMGETSSKTVLGRATSLWFIS
jgi:hypothetical protein